MYGPSQRNISVESEKGFLGYHLQCCSKWATASVGGKEKETQTLQCLVLLTLSLMIVHVYQEIKELSNPCIGNIPKQQNDLISKTACEHVKKPQYKHAFLTAHFR